MCSCGADRNAAKSPFNWQHLTESSSDNHDQNIAEHDDESEAEALPSSIQPTLQIKPDGIRVKHRACQPFDCCNTGVTNPTEMLDPTKCSKSLCEDPNLCQAESEVSAEFL